MSAFVGSSKRSCIKQGGCWPLAPWYEPRPEAQSLPLKRSLWKQGGLWALEDRDGSSAARVLPSSTQDYPPPTPPPVHALPSFPPGPSRPSRRIRPEAPPRSSRSPAHGGAGGLLGF